ncbi:MAG: hypothetical protein ACRDMZ_11750, partial [Solirubrobacteraceae bacterium]
AVVPAYLRSPALWLGLLAVSTFCAAAVLHGTLAIAAALATIAGWCAWSNLRRARLHAEQIDRR